ncbi:MAG TPA: hypothetical protein VGN73_09900 [Gemmatimonadaceae bacterium]|nr:hypothetical protein [Gemmatimonadaceae bacterium]
MNRDVLRITPQLLLWMLGFIAIVLVGVSLTMDLRGQSAADFFVIRRWSFEGLRVYLWLEGLLLTAIVAALGMHVVTTGFAVARGAASRMFGIAVRLHPTVPRQFGYVFVVLGASLVALSITTLVLLNSCRYMRIV